MKNGKKPTVNQRKLMEAMGINSENWLVVKDTSSEMEIVHRYSDSQRRTIYKGDL